MTKNEGQKIADDFHKKHRSLKNNGHKIIVVDRPQDYNEELRGQNVKGFHRAADNDTYIIASEHKNKDDLLKTIKHESYGHYGLNTLPQENKIDILLSVVHLQDTALKDEWQQVRYDYPDMKEFRQAEEVFCSVVSEVTTRPEFQHSFSDTIESKKEIQDVGKYIKMTLQTGDAKQVIIPKNNNLQFNQYTDKELGMKNEVHNFNDIKVGNRTVNVEITQTFKNSNKNSKDDLIEFDAGSGKKVLDPGTGAKSYSTITKIEGSNEKYSTEELNKIKDTLSRPQKQGATLVEFETAPLTNLKNHERSKEKELDKTQGKSYAIKQGKITEVPKEQVKSNETSFTSRKMAITYQVATGNTHNFSKQDKQVLSENFKEITSQAYKNYPTDIKESKSLTLKETFSTINQKNNEIQKDSPKLSNKEEKKMIEKVKSFCKERDAKQKAPEKSLGMER